MRADNNKSRPLLLHSLGAHTSLVHTQSFALTAQQLMVAYGLHEPYHAAVARPLSPQCALAHEIIHYCIRPRRDRSTRVSYVSRLLQQNPLVKLASFSGSFIPSWISTLGTMPPLAAALHYKSWIKVQCMWPLTSPLSAMFVQWSERI